jgi:hypothetical protein
LTGLLLKLLAELEGILSELALAMGVRARIGAASRSSVLLFSCNCISLCFKMLSNCQIMVSFLAEPDFRCQAVLRPPWLDLHLYFLNFHSSLRYSF